jgi:hypothetical protein
VSLAWHLTSGCVKAGVLGGVAVAAIAAFLARRQIASLTSAACAWIRGRVTRAIQDLLELPARFGLGT